MTRSTNSLGRFRYRSAKQRSINAKLRLDAMPSIKKGMTAGVRLALMAALVLCGCRTAHDVAVASYRVATAPVNLVRHRPPDSTAANPPNATTESSTVATTHDQPPPAPPPPAPTPHRSVPPQTVSTVDDKPRPTSSPRPVSSQLQFPTAKPVEGKPGYVYSPFDAGKYVDVSGYAPGSKVKDPYSGKIFLVP
jgi:hypothetical protein